MENLKKIILDALSDGEYLGILKEYGLSVTQKKVDTLFSKVEKVDTLQDLQAIDSKILGFILSELRASQALVK